MKVKPIWLLIVAMLLCIPGAALAETVSFEVMMVEASNGNGAKDPKLSKIEGALRASLGKFNTFKYRGGGRSAVAIPGNGTVSLGGGYSVEIAGKSADSGRVTAGVQWKKGDTRMLNTTINAKRGSPTVFARPQAGGTALAVVIIPR